MARPRKPVAVVLDNRVTVRLTAAEHKALAAAADRDGVTTAALARERITGGDPNPDRNARARLSAVRVDPALVVQVAHFGRNLNQVARRANGLGRVDFDTVMQLRGIRALLDELVDYYTDRPGEIGPLADQVERAEQMLADLDNQEMQEHRRTSPPGLPGDPGVNSGGEP